MSAVDPSALSVVERFRESHHAIARAFAAGKTPSMVYRETGVSIRRLNLLWNDPSFQELIRVYAIEVQDEWKEETRTNLELLHANWARSELLIQERLNSDNAHEIPLMTLDRISQGRADRIGYGKNMTVEHKHDFASMLDRAIDRSAKVIEGEALVPAPPSLPSPGPQPAEVPPVPRSKVVAQQIASQPVKRRRVG